MGQDLMQFVGAGFNPLKELSKMTGESFESLQEKMSKGQITAKNVAQAIAHATGEGGQFHGMMDALGASGAGAWNTMMGAIQSGAVSIYEQVKPYLLDLFEIVGKYVPKVFAVIGGVINAVVGTVRFFERWKTTILVITGIIVSLTIAVKLQRIAQYGLAAASLIAKGAMTALAGAQAALNAVQAIEPTRDDCPHNRGCSSRWLLPVGISSQVFVPLSSRCGTRLRASAVSSKST